MPKYNQHSLALTDAEEIKFQNIRKTTGFGIKKIFMAMVDALTPKNDTVGDGRNKSAITLNLEE